VRRVPIATFAALLVVAHSVPAQPRPCTWPELKPDPQNLTFSSGTVGAAPVGWRLGQIAPPHEPVYEAMIAPANQCHISPQCATVHSLRSDPNARLSFLYQDLDVTPHRGQILSYRAYVRVDPGSVARLLVRVHRRDCSTTFRDDMGNHPVTSGDWAVYEIRAPIATDAFHVEFGMQLIGQGAAWIDQISMEFGPVRFSQVVPSPSFEFVSVKRNYSTAQRSEFDVNPDGLITITNYQLRFLIPYAYLIGLYQIGGAPSWLASNKYDIIARAPAGSSEYQVQLMLEQLLKDRFGLKFHNQRKEITGYAVVLANGGAKFAIETKQPGPNDGRFGAGRGGIRGHMVSSDAFAQTLSVYLERPVIDQTGIEGLFNFELHWTPNETELQPGGVQLPSATPSTDPAGPSLLTALEEQL